MHPNISKLAHQGQSIWIDNISRRMLDTGELQKLIEDGVVGLTSNPTIFQKAIVETRDYQNILESLARAGKCLDEVYEALVFDDIRRAADLMGPVYRRTDRRDGFVSIEVSPRLAHDTHGSIEQGRRIFRTLNRPNVMIKVPGTPEGIPAIEELLSEGVNVNVTLIFSVECYRQVMGAYLRGMERWTKSGGDPTAVASVASFFVSRIDTAVDQALQNKIDNGRKELGALLGKAAIANAKLAYAAYQEIFEGPNGAFSALTKRGARAQRPLWASTSTKNPNYRSTYYVDTLVGAHTVNTVPPATLDAIRAGFDFCGSLTEGLDESLGVFRQLEIASISMEQITRDLQVAGVKAFADSFNSLMSDIETKRVACASTESASPVSASPR